MADVFYGVGLGAKNNNDVTVGASTGSTKIELRVETAVTGLTGNKVELLKSLAVIQRYIEQDGAPA